LAKDAGRKVFLILDNLKVHHSNLVKEWLEEQKKQLEVFYLKAYCQQLNPDDYLNNHLKSGVHKGEVARTWVLLQKKMISHLRRLQKQPLKVNNFNEHSKVA
jgi:hypothetical protein